MGRRGTHNDGSASGGGRDRATTTPLSKSQVDQAGRLLARLLERARAVGDGAYSEFDREQLETAERIADAWRRRHAKPLSSVAANLRYYVAGHGRPEVAQRLKRFPTMIDKLLREPTMRLSQMADIGGTRAVLPDQEAAYSVARALRRNWTIVSERDYVADPKEDGYRALHLIARRRGALIEVQLRTPTQHLWANLVEESSRMIGVDLKGAESPREVRERFRELAATLADLEAIPHADLANIIQRLGAMVDTAIKRVAKRTL